MYCIQCEQTMRSPIGDGCLYAQGMCGKTAETSDLQDLLIAVLQGTSAVIIAAKEKGVENAGLNAFVPRAMFSTLTNVNFDSEKIIHYAQEAIRMRNELATQAHITVDHPFANITIQTQVPSILQVQANHYKLDHDRSEIGDDVHGVRMLCIYGLKGAAAYMEHACALGETNGELHQEFHRINAWLGTQPSDMSALLTCAMDIGQLNFQVMAMLDHAETTHLGNPMPQQVNMNTVMGKAILISGHDLNDLKHLLEQTKDLGINVYTHGEMLPAHGYPELKKYPHLAGNYGTAWQNQQTEFAQFPGPIIMTSNCLIDPNVGQYADRVWTMNIVGWPNVKHLENHDFGGIIAQAQSMNGFTENQTPRMLTVGFGRETLVGAIDPIIDLVSSGQLKHVFLVGGCDGSKGERNYFTEVGQQIPQDCLVLTLGCGKFRLNHMDFGTLGGLPRLIDVGQCNDAYAAIILAVELSKKLGCDINDLPLSLVLSWFEQKAIVILLTLLSLGVKNIYTGPTKPAFLTDTVLDVLNQKFGLRTTTTAEADIKTAMAG